MVFSITPAMPALDAPAAKCHRFINL